MQLYVGNADNPTNGVQPDFANFQECGYFEGPATDGGPHFFNCPGMLLGRYVAIIITDESPSVLYLCEVKVCGFSAPATGKHFLKRAYIKVISLNTSDDNLHYKSL